MSSDYTASVKHGEGGQTKDHRRTPCYPSSQTALFPWCRWWQLSSSCCQFTASYSFFIPTLHRSY